MYSEFHEFGNAKENVFVRMSMNSEKLRLSISRASASLTATEAPIRVFNMTFLSHSMMR